MQNEIKQNWFFDRSPQEVWEYLTKPELMEQWLMKSDFQPVVGHKFHFIGNCNDDGKTAAQCEVLEVTPYTRLSYSWQTNSFKDNRPFDSMVVWTLAPADNGTNLQLVHSGFTVAEDFLAHSEGWTSIGKKIAGFLNSIAK